MKKLILILLASAMLTGLIACNDSETPDNTNRTSDSNVTTTTENPGTNNPGQTASDFQYEEGAQGVTIIGYTGTAVDVIIPETINGKPVTAIGNGAFTGNQSIVSAAMPNTVTNIGDEAFKECASLTSVILSDQLESIGEFAFYRCVSLKQIRIPKSIKTWGVGVFGFCGLENIELEDGLEAIGPGAFELTTISQIHIPDSVQTIHSNAFMSCRNLESVSLGNGVRFIEDGVFALNETIQEIVIPKSVEKIDSLAFDMCTNLKQLKFEGNAPEFNTESEGEASYTVYYHKGAEGFTSPEWNGHPAEIW